MTQLLNDAGFGDVKIVPLAPDAHAKGPELFVAMGNKRQL